MVDSLPLIDVNARGFRPKRCQGIRRLAYLSRLSVSVFFGRVVFICLFHICLAISFWLFLIILSHCMILCPSCLRIFSQLYLRSLSCRRSFCLSSFFQSWYLSFLVCVSLTVLFLLFFEVSSSVASAVSLSLSIYIYIWRRPRFLPTFLPF